MLRNCCETPTRIAANLSDSGILNDCGGRCAWQTQAMRPALEEILAPVRQDFAASGTTEDELDVLVETERHAIWEEKHVEES